MKKKSYQFCLVIACFLLITDCTAQSGGWQSLFDGKTLNGWMRLAGKADYSVENGMIVGTAVLNSGNTFLATQKEYGDFILELDI
ncbi:MAG TPA: DUF1080 domain-containing protein, partial [Ginsengibacter sp.]|nr:DUF1080 domain-containing protein [Ginsengibacter sp.]